MQGDLTDADEADFFDTPNESQNYEDDGFLLMTKKSLLAPVVVVRSPSFSCSVWFRGHLHLYTRPHQTTRIRQT